MDLKEGQQPQRCLFENWEREKSLTNSNWSPERHWVVLAFVPETEVFWVAGWWRGHGGEKESFLVCENTHAHRHTQNISLLTCFHCLHLRAFVTVTFGSHLICASPLVPQSHIPLLFSWGSFQASLLTVPPRAHASLSSLSLLALFLSTSPAFPAFTLILSLHFSIIVFFHYYLSLSFSLCLFFWHFLLPELNMPFNFIYPLDQFQSVSFLFFPFLPSGCFIPLLSFWFPFSCYLPLRAGWYLSSFSVCNFVYCQTKI